jgi:thioredoxin 1
MSLYRVSKAALAALMLFTLPALGPSGVAAASAETPNKTAPVPKLVDLGSGSCYPCKKMAPILDALREEYAGQFDVVFIDIAKEPDAATPYRIRVIPTQIFYDAGGKELYRHMGFFSRDQILDKWRALGFTFAAAKTPQ